MEGSYDLVSADSVEVMSLVACVIQLMFVLCACLQRKDSSSDLYIVSPQMLIKSYQQDFEKLLFSDFPYSVQVHIPQKKKRKKDKTFQSIDSGASQSLVALNLAICDIMSSFCADPAFKPSYSYLKKMETYLVRSLEKSPSMEQSKILVRVLKNVFSNPHIYASFSKAYSAAVKHYFSCSVKTPQKLLFYNLFSFMARSWDGWKRDRLDTIPICRYKHSSDVSDMLEDFLQSLPQLLLDVASFGNQRVWLIDILTFMAHGHVQNCSHTFHDSFMAKLTEILDSESGVLTCNDEDVQNRLFSLLSLGTPLNEDHLRQVLYLIRRPIDKPVLHRRKSRSVVSHAIYSVISCIRKYLPLTSQRVFNNMTSDQQSQLSDYLRFMFSLQIGMTGEELEAVSPPGTTNEGSDRWFSVDFTVQGDQWERHVEIASLVARELASFHIPAMPSKGYHQSFTFFNNLEQLWKQTFMNRSRVHIMSAYSMIQFFCQASWSHVVEKPGPEFYKLASYIVVSVLTSINYQSDLNSAPSEQIVWQIKSDVIQCLTSHASLLDLVMELLDMRSKDTSSTVDREASRAAQYFLLLDENITVKLKKNTGDGEMVACSVMDVS